ncbi:MAG: A/G-specific adenine glycosylase [Acidimicrobiales bacterium]
MTARPEGRAAVAGEAAPLDRGEILRWAERGLRDLPWRRTRDPWAILVSELMLQQTQTARVAPRWRAFLCRFPTPAACAAASPGEVVRLWAGLGYNRRALNLHGCAQAVVERHGGALPGELAELLALPGVGPYTARAVLAFAFEAPAAVVDTNVARFLARRAGRRLGRAEAQAAADALAPEDRSWTWNQALLDLGATVCTARSPRCGECPAEAGCAWRGEGPDPAVGSAGVSTRQSTFGGSDRQGRGRLVDALRCGPVPRGRLGEVMGWPDDPDRAARVAAGVVADGLAVQRGRVLVLP